MEKKKPSRIISFAFHISSLTEQNTKHPSPIPKTNDCYSKQKNLRPPTYVTLVKITPRFSLPETPKASLDQSSGVPLPSTPVSVPPRSQLPPTWRKEVLAVDKSVCEVELLRREFRYISNTILVTDSFMGLLQFLEADWTLSARDIPIFEPSSILYSLNDFSVTICHAQEFI
ncbi:hypothetical protein CEXT_762051 [Caerostris extrusa]|uniref:Uncharacterized protein n=1 Tax=Caerostris extrusa TaxID=172846 RepID=A0AAV4U631_CAEEX|nr:hypothetical protein CEXT_762051 [Caerostris extrusa]